MVEAHRFAALLADGWNLLRKNLLRLEAAQVKHSLVEVVKVDVFAGWLLGQQLEAVKELGDLNVLALDLAAKVRLAVYHAGKAFDLANKSGHAHSVALLEVAGCLIILAENDNSASLVSL